MALSFLHKIGGVVLTVVLLLHWLAVAQLKQHETLSLLQQSQPSQQKPLDSLSPLNAKKGFALPRNRNKELTTTKTHVSKPQKSPAAAPWKESKVIPQWMKDYFQWHQDSLQKIRDTNDWKQFDFLVFRCLEHDNKCGGAADRLKPLPLLLLVASKLKPKRIVFYKWERPAALEHFLVPPNLEGALDWRWPPHPDLANFSFPSAVNLNQRMIRNVFGLEHDEIQLKPFYEIPHLPKIATFRFQSTSHGQKEYNQMRTNNETEASYNEVFRDVWFSVFTPSPPVQERIDQTMARLHLQRDMYHAIHIRSQYHVHFSEARLLNLSQNAVNCLFDYVSNHRSLPVSLDTPVFLATDGRAANRLAVQYAKSLGLNRVVSRVNASNEADDQQGDASLTLHLDRGLNFIEQKANKWTRHEAPQYYDTFVDMYILSQAQCIVFNVGNYGKWSNLLSSDPSCEYSHMKDKSCVFPTHAMKQK